MRDLVTVVVLGLATYRLALFAHESQRGPYGVFDRLRAWAGKRAAVKQGGFWFEFAELLHCPHCAGVWISFGLTFIVFGLTGKAILFAFAVAGLQSFMYGLTRVSHG